MGLILFDRRHKAEVIEMADKHLKILLVDDDEDDYIMTRDLLSEIDGKKITLDWLSTYDAALESIARDTYDVYLFDYRLGERTGLELLSEAVANGCTGPIILLTGQGGRDVDVEAMKAGAADYLCKGEINAHLLERSIRYALERNQAKEQILHIAYYDSLTNLPNRVLFQDRLKQVIELSHRHKRTSALLFLDLDNFKRINDSLGHRIGDILLNEVSKRLTRCIRRSDSISRMHTEESEITVARLGGDEFTILLTEISDFAGAARVAQRILGSLVQPFLLDDHEVFITASIGVAVYPDDGENAEVLLKNADTAMYYSKSQGKNNYQFYRRSMNATAFEKLTLENDLRKALDRKELILYYQPQIELNTGNIFGMEALLRWKHPDIGIISPGEFIPLAEETGLIVSIGEWVLSEACRQSQSWKDAGFPQLSMSVNMSSQQFTQRGLMTTITQALNSSGLDPHYLILEITESIIMQKTRNILTTLQKLHLMGIRISMDDFGTGYSSLSYLKRFPIHAIKIDRSFIKEVNTNQDDAAISRAIIAMARSLNLKVVAEGVESEHQLAFLCEENCNYVQGFLISRPLPPEEITKLLIQDREGSSIGLALCKKLGK